MYVITLVQSPASLLQRSQAISVSRPPSYTPWLRVVGFEHNHSSTAESRDFGKAIGTYLIAWGLPLASQQPHEPHNFLRAGTGGIWHWRADHNTLPQRPPAATGLHSTPPRSARRRCALQLSMVACMRKSRVAWCWSYIARGVEVVK